MNHFAKIVGKLPEYGIDAMLLTHEANRFTPPGSAPPEPTARPW